MGDVILVAVLALPLVGFWLVMRGQQRRAAEATRLASSLRIGQDVVTTSGLYGTIATLDETEVTLLVAPGVELRFDRRAIGRVLDDESDTPGPE
jgi:preprotein translocase subunit YajC